MLTKAFIPYGGYYSTPFARWQGTLSNEHSLILGANTAKRWFSAKKIDPKDIDYLILGATIGQKQWFYGAPWTAALMGNPDISGMTISQACTTSATCVWQAAVNVENGVYNNVFTLMADRTSNGAHTVWPNPKGPGGQVESENWMMDNFNKDPWAGDAMIVTAERVAKELGLSKEALDEDAWVRYSQYKDALENDREFQKRYMFPVEANISKKKKIVLEEDEGIFLHTEESIKQLKPALNGGIITSASQTHPADGNCGLIVTTKDNAKDLSTNADICIQIISYGYHRAKAGYMPMGPPPAAKKALENANISVKDLKAIKTHNPFATNDLFMAKEMSIDVRQFNNYGSSLVYGHPQGPTAGRAIIEGIEEVVLLGGGYFLFAGCAAGDCGVGLVLKIS
ncbi:Acetyl-CoA C-acetyltransferase [Desulfosarcina cetonica]|uniref:thiolase family protein n=1 Tax=Desulfosarcina cetonica TaxID=90730 RepID=UPI0006D0BD96|nr:thiolase family protein [Desulfosarcina cetonica]VTR66213.1 Acetyl-CoA C-acetyltransferase [Desulfosarcina cetonica]